MCNPYEFATDASNNVKSAVFNRNLWFNEEEAIKGKKMITTDQKIEIPCQLVVKSIGYK